MSQTLQPDDGGVTEAVESMEDTVNDFFSPDEENKNVFLTTDDNNNYNYSNNDNNSQHSRIRSQVASKRAPHPTSQSKQPTSMSNGRRPVNTSTNSNIYDINSNNTKPVANNNNNNNSNYRAQPPNNSYQPQPQQQQQQNKMQKSNNQNQVNKNQVQNRQQNQPSQNNNNTFRTQISPTNMNNPNSTSSSGTPNYGGTRIAKRELWWKEPPQSDVKITTGRKVNIENVSPRVDHYNKNYQPSRESSKIIENRKLEWNAKPATDTWGNFLHFHTQYITNI